MLHYGFPLRLTSDREHPDADDRSHQYACKSARTELNAGACLVRALMILLPPSARLPRDVRPADRRCRARLPPIAWLPRRSCDRKTRQYLAGIPRLRERHLQQPRYAVLPKPPDPGKCLQSGLAKSHTRAREPTIVPQKPRGTQNRAGRGSGYSEARGLIAPAFRRRLPDTAPTRWYRAQSTVQGSVFDSAIHFLERHRRSVLLQRSEQA